MDNNYREISSVEEDAKEGLLYQCWKQDWGLKISTWYGMDKIKFSFIEVGAGGKGKSFNIFMPTIKDDATCFDNWAHDIMDDIGVQSIRTVLAAESKAGEKYPKYYKFITGENGEKSLGICNSTKGGYCINASITRPTGENDEKGNPKYKKDFCNISISYYDLRRIAERYLRTYEERREELEEMRIQAIKESSRPRKEKSNAPIEEVAPEAKPETPEKTDKKATSNAEKGDKKKRTVVKNTDTREEVYKMYSDGIKCFDLLINSQLKELSTKPGTYFCTARNEADTKKYNLFITPEAKEKLPKEGWDIMTSNAEIGVEVKVAFAANEKVENDHTILEVLQFLGKSE
jgi:hypothetical protein